MPGARYAALIANNNIVNHYQPIVDLQTGDVVGVEVLGRLIEKDKILSPAVFLQKLSVDALEDLLYRSLSLASDEISDLTQASQNFKVSFNLSPKVLMRTEFAEKFLKAVDDCRFATRSLTLEILENHDISNTELACETLNLLKAAGIKIALDDVGTGYSSLSRVRELPVDIIKLDQSFIRTLSEFPENLHFVIAVASLSRGLRIKLVVEGVETNEIAEALSLLGIQSAQGYAIARPMGEERLREWLANHFPSKAKKTPTCLLGAYAAHLAIAEALRTIEMQPLAISISDSIQDAHSCVIGQYFDKQNLHDTAIGKAHKMFHRAIASGEPISNWEQISATLWLTLQAAIKAQFHMRTDSVFQPSNVPVPETCCRFDGLDSLPTRQFRVCTAVSPMRH